MTQTAIKLDWPLVHGHQTGGVGGSISLSPWLFQALPPLASSGIF